MDEARGGPDPGADGALRTGGGVRPEGGGGLQPDAGGRSPYRTTCPYFRHEGPDGAILLPFERPDPANRCVAIGWPVEPSFRQQAMGCLSPEHTSCPRYTHAEAIPPEAVVRVVPPRPQPRSRPSRARRPGGGTSRPRSPATLGSLLLLLASVSLSFAFVLLHGGMALPDRSPRPSSEVAVATGTPAPTAVAAAPTPAPPTATPVVTQAPTAAPTPSPTPVPTARPTPTPRPTSERYAYLEPCPGRPDCWIYTIRRGDALYNLARYFGHPIETIYRLNPWTRERGIRAGDKLFLPPPTL